MHLASLIKDAHGKGNRTTKDIMMLLSEMKESRIQSQSSVVKMRTANSREVSLERGHGGLMHHASLPAVT